MATTSPSAHRLINLTTMPLRSNSAGGGMTATLPLTARKPSPAPGKDLAGDPAVPAIRGGVVARPELFRLLGEAARVTQISAPAGSGKTVLLRSWAGEASLAERAAWVSMRGNELDPQRFWILVTDALRGTSAGSAPVRPLTAAPNVDGWAVVERLLKDLASLEDRLWLVIDDVHELRSAEARRQLELLVLRAPPELRLVLATRHDLRLGLHRLRLEGELTEIRAADLRFTLGEARALFRGAGVELSDAALALLHDRTEGWPAGLRLAALSLAGHPDPERFATEFSGSERTVAEYLLAEVLERQSEPVRRLLLRTSVLDQVNGELADLLTGGSGGERVLQDLEDAGAFVVSLDARRSWFRYHRLFADLLQLELRRAASEGVAGLHATAAGWCTRNGYPAQAVRHAQAAQDWPLAARLLSDHFLGLVLDGHGATVHRLLAGFPADTAAGDAELTMLMAADEVNRGSLQTAERYLALAAGQSADVPADRRGGFQVKLAVLRLNLAQRRGDLPAVVEDAQRLLAPAEGADATRLQLGDELRALALVTLGAAELWAPRPDEAERHLEQAAVLARRIGRPWLEISGLAHRAMAARFRSFALAVDPGRQAIELARRHGWTTEPVVAPAYLALAVVSVWQGRLEEAEPLLDRAQRALRAGVQPAAGVVLHSVRGAFELARGHDASALAAHRAADKLGELLIAAHPLATQARALLLRTLVRLGETGRTEAALAAMEQRERETGQMRIAAAVLRLAQHHPQAAIAALAPVLDGSAPVFQSVWRVEAQLLEAIARDALGDPAATGRALERALDLAEADAVLFPFLLHPAPGLLERHARHRTGHAALISEILDLLAGARRSAPPVGEPAHLSGPISDSEIRVLRYLPTNLSAPEIAAELTLSVNTIRTHVRRLYEKLGAGSRTEAVDRARALGLLAPSSRRPGG
jgi:LuxR family maltose regulon positive regulatory protein